MLQNRNTTTISHKIQYIVRNRRERVGAHVWICLVFDFSVLFTLDVLSSVECNEKLIDQIEKLRLKSILLSDFNRFDKYRLRNEVVWMRDVNDLIWHLCLIDNYEMWMTTCCQNIRLPLTFYGPSAQLLPWIAHVHTKA